MKLNIDCVRSILLEVESVVTFNTFFIINETDYKDFQLLKDYTYDEIVYHMSQCSKSGLIYGFSASDNGEIVKIVDLSPYGHQFIEETRSKTVWEQVKSISSKVGATTLDSVIRVSSNVIFSLIQAELTKAGLI